MTWPDGVAGAAWVLPQGTVVEVSRVHVDAPGGFTVRAHPVEAPELFLVAPVGAMRPLGQRLPF